MNLTELPTMTVLRAVIRQPVEATLYEVWHDCQEVGSSVTVQVFLNRLRDGGFVDEVVSITDRESLWCATEKGRRTLL